VNPALSLLSRWAARQIHSGSYKRAGRHAVATHEMAREMALMAEPDLEKLPHSRALPVIRSAFLLRLD
jgi:hypothetical protein